MTMEDIRRISPAYRRADEYAQFFLASQKGTQMRRLMVKLGIKRNAVTNFFKLFAKIDEDDYGMVTLDEFFNYLRIDWIPFIGKAFRAMDTETDGMSADQLEPDEWIIGLYNYCTLTPEALGRFAFELYDDDGSEFISHDELETMVDDVYGGKGNVHFDREEHVKQLVSILDADGDGVIEYDEWKKVAHKAQSILKPAIVLQTFLSARCFGESFWAREKARTIPIIAKLGYPNVLQFYKKEVVAKRPDAVEAKLATQWLGEEVSLETGNQAYDEERGETGNLNLKGVMKAKMLARSVQEKVAQQRDPTQHGFVNPFRGAKVVDTYGAVKVKDQMEWVYEEDEENDDEKVKQLKHAMLMLQIREAKAHAPKETRHGSLKYPDGRVIKVSRTTPLKAPNNACTSPTNATLLQPKKPDLKDRSNDDPVTLQKGIKDKYNKKGKMTKEEKLSIEEQRKKAKAYRDRLEAFAKAKCDLMMDRYDLYVDPAKEEIKDKFWEKKVSLGVVKRDEDE